MVHKLTSQQYARLEEAFAMCDTHRDGTIDTDDLECVLRHLGHAPSIQFQMLYEDHDGVDGRIGFDELLDIVTGPHAYRDPYDEWGDLLNSFATYDEGTGYIPLRDLMCALENHLEESYRNFTDDELVDIYRQILDVSLLEGDSQRMAPESMWKAVYTEIAAMRKNERPPSLVGHLQNAADSDCIVHVTVGAVSGETLMIKDIAASCSVEELKQSIEDAMGLPVSRQLLLLGGRVLCQENGTLFEAGARDAASLTLIVREELMVDYAQFAGKLMDLL